MCSSDLDTATAKYRGDVLTGQELSRKRAQENIQYNRNIASGEVEGAMLPLNEISTTPGTKDVLDTNLANKKLKEMSDAGTFDSAPTEEAAQKAYHEYLAKNDPNYYKSQPRKIGEAMVQNTGRMVPYVGQAVQGVRDFVMGDSSTHGQYQKGLNAPKDVKPTGVQSFEDFSKERYGTKEEQIKMNKDTKTAVAKWLTTDKAGGAITEKEIEIVNRVPRDELIKQANVGIAAYAKKHKTKKYSVPASKLQGMRKAAMERINKIENSRATSDTAIIKEFNSKATLQMKQNFRLQLAKYEAELGKELSPSEAAKIKKTMLESDLLQQKYNDNKGWFE